MFKYLIVIGLMCGFFGGILLIYDIRPTLRDKITVEEALDRNHRRKEYPENILSVMVDIIKGRKEFKLLETEPNKILHHNEREKEHEIRFKLGVIAISIGFLLQIIGIVGTW